MIEVLLEKNVFAKTLLQETVPNWSLDLNGPHEGLFEKLSSLSNLFKKKKRKEKKRV